MYVAEYLDLIANPSSHYFNKILGQNVELAMSWQEVAIES